RQLLVGFQVLSSCSGDYLRRQSRRRAVLVPASRFEPVAHELLVKRGRALADLVLIHGPEARAIRRQDFIDENQVAARQLAPFELGVCDDDASATSVLSRTL